MRCLHVITGLNSGGAEGVLYNLCIHDLNNIHTVVSLSDDGLYGPLLRESNIKVISLNINGYLSLFNAFIRLFRIIRSKKPDVVQTWMYHADFFGGIIAKMSGVKRIFWNVRHTHLDLNLMKFRTILISKFCAIFSKVIPDKIICCSRKAIDSHVEFGYKKNKFVLISNGYDLKRFSPQSNLSLTNQYFSELDKSIPVIGMISRYAPEKDHKNFLRALNILRKKNIRFYCIFIGLNLNIDNAELMKWIKQYKLNKHVKLFDVQRDIPAFLNALDLHVLSSKDEAFPNILGEAMACGTPCISTNVGEAEYILGECGWIVESQNSVSLAKALEEAFDMMNDKSRWLKLKTSSRKRIEENFSLEKMKNDYVKAWQSVI
jgi:glycosyltransferase involved in cell wall biosynthesis